ncbi:hypothetical protein [Cohnella candidum]|uniref:DUF4031 domain-containing protein n=1 Tax=Cohnella candidum TaxID=2674991 RepID=A0A3G3JXE9_9BACL|nr:hypothetical protein [Cohnella candidum]AYQ72916.1 hypothetical protein EAV92_10290 [Cohnella candidum]
MAFGIKREELQAWKDAVARGEIAFITHYWLEPRFPGIHTVTKVGCADLDRLSEWCVANGLNPRYIHRRQPFPHFDLIGPKQKEILARERLWEQMRKFGMLDD